MSATSARSDTQTPTDPGQAARGDLSFPKQARLLRSSEFRTVYAKGLRFTGPYFAAFCLHRGGSDEARVGLTVPRALGKAVIRNRLKRRVREAVRLRRGRLEPGWDIVINPRKAVLAAAFEALLGEVERLFARCKQ